MNQMIKDKFYIYRALKLARKANNNTSPNPMVGAILVKNNKIIAEDYHKKSGEQHAESLVIKQAGKAAIGSTLYVTLEPCCHLDKKTPPCTKTIINAGIPRVVISMKDPNRKVSGNGIHELTDNGIKVSVGICEDKARELNEFYIKYITTKKPFVILKTAMTLDGKIATPQGQSKWITSEKQRRFVYRLRSSVDAVMTAIGTVKSDNPSLTARIKNGRDPKRIIIDPLLETPINYAVCSVPPQTIVVTQKSNLETKKAQLLKIKHIKIIGYEGQRVDLKWLIEKCTRFGIYSIMIEAGASLNASAFKDNIVDKIIFFIAPKIIGGKDSITPVGGNFFQNLETAYRVKDIKIKKIGNDLMIQGYIDHIVI